MLDNFWAVVRSKPRQERRANDNLQAQGYKTLLPFQKTTVCRSRQLVERRTHLFPGYLFVELSENYYRSILSTFGVSQLITGEGGQPKKIDYKIIAEISKNCDESGLYSHADSLSTGDEVRLTRGPFVSALAQVQSVQSKDRLWVLLDLLGQSVRVSVRRADAEKI